LRITGTLNDWLLGEINAPDPNSSGGAAGTKTVRVICKPTQVTIGNKTRHVEIYKCLSSAMLVEKLYGIAKRNGAFWAVMEDTRSLKSLATAINEKSLPETIPERLSFALEVTQTVSYLHSVNMLVKGALSDTTILVHWDGAVARPRFTDLQQARNVGHLILQRYVEFNCLIAVDNYRWSY
jgi:hypothetical protein